MHKSYQDARIVKLNDWHIPFQDTEALTTAIAFTRSLNPDILIIDEIIDFYAISKFDKDPRRKLNLQKEIDETLTYLNILRKIFQRVRIIMLNSNHLDRLGKYLRGKAPELYYLRSLDIRELFKLDEFKIEFMETYVHNGMFIFKHGDVARKHSGWSARAEYEKEGMSGASGHCFSDDTELLTPRGWKKGIDIDENDIVATMNKKTRMMEWNFVNEKFVYNNYTELIHIFGMTIDLLVTNDHGIIYENSIGDLVECKAKELLSKKYFTLINSTNLTNNIFNIDINDNWIRLIIQIVTDGTFDDNQIRWHLKKERKIIRLKNLLDRMGFKYSCYIDKYNSTRINLDVELSNKIRNRTNLKEKILPNYFIHLTKKANIILEEYSLTDGCKNSASKNSYQISSSKEVEIDILQALFSSSGYRSIKLNRDKGRFLLTVNKRRKIKLKKDNIKVIPYSGKVWCVSVNNGTLIARRNGKVAVTLNCHKLGVYNVTKRGGRYVWAECGCLCCLDQEYITGVPDWQHGLVCVDFVGDKFLITPYGIFDGTMILNRKIITGKDVFPQNGRRKPKIKKIDNKLQSENNLQNI